MGKVVNSFKAVVRSRKMQIGKSSSGLAIYRSFVDNLCHRRFSRRKGKLLTKYGLD